MMALPQDVFNLVIDELGRLPDVKTLRACSMTCSSFRCPSQSHIFRRVDLGRRTPRKKYFHRFASLISKTPRIGTYVRDLRIEDDWGRDVVNGVVITWIAHSEHLVQLLPMLTRLMSLTLKFNSGFAPWNLFTKDVRTAIINTLRSPGVVSVSLSHIEAFPPAIVSSLVRLKHLQLSAIKLDKTSSQDEASNVRPEFLLKSLDFASTSSTTVRLLHEIISFSSATTLRNLSLAPPEQDDLGPCVWSLMQLPNVAQHLTHFEWMPVHIHARIGPIDISILPNLRSVRILVSLRQDMPFAQLLRLLNQPTSRANKIQTIAMIFDLTDLPQFRGASGWVMLENTLMKLAYGRLKEMRLGLTESAWLSLERKKRPLSKATVVALLEDQFPTLRARKGVIVVGDEGGGRS